jgi:membrane-bound lytic murein transglycosylase B
VLRIITARTNRQLNRQIIDLSSRAEAHRRRELVFEQRIEKALELLQDHDIDPAAVRAVLKGDDRQ